MADESGHETVAPGLESEAAQTRRLLVELLHAAYATRRRGEDGSHAVGHPDWAGSTPDEPAVAISSHAVRAAIHVYRHGERTVGQVAGGLGISYGWASRVVDELEKAHYLVRSRDEKDRRIVRVRLDPRAVEAVERAYAWGGPAVVGALESLSPEGREAVRLFLRTVVDSLRRETA
jgi:DNA-binding MarR family transcriptional regulator